MEQEKEKYIEKNYPCYIYGCMPSTLRTDDGEEIETICARCGSPL